MDKAHWQITETFFFCETGLQREICSRFVNYACEPENLSTRRCQGKCVLDLGMLETLNKELKKEKKRMNLVLAWLYK